MRRLRKPQASAVRAVMLAGIMDIEMELAWPLSSFVSCFFSALMMAAVEPRAVEASRERLEDAVERRHGAVFRVARTLP